MSEGCSEQGDLEGLLAGDPEEGEEKEEGGWRSMGSCGIPAQGSTGGTMGTWSMGLAEHCSTPAGQSRGDAHLAWLHHAGSIHGVMELPLLPQ